MAKDDGYTVIIYSAAAVGTMAFLYRYGRTLIQERFFAWIYTKWIIKRIAIFAVPYKQKLLSKLADQKTKFDQLTILEIGSGPGTNFAFYPKNCRLICYDPNPYFNPALFERQKQFPELNLERVVTSGAENLVETDDESVDAVVSTYVLCSVEDMEKVLSEIKRVLVPGGVYYFMEHTNSPPGTFKRFLKTVVNPAWKFASVSCHLTRDIGSAIRNSGFSKLDMDTFILPIEELWHRTFVSDTVMGTAIK